jgi:Arc/MetJ-type ribon-helix-helix transcriptional regulator
MVSVMAAPPSRVFGSVVIGCFPDVGWAAELLGYGLRVSVQITVRLSQSEAADLDALVSAGGFSSRSAALRTGLRRLSSQVADRDIIAACAAGRRRGDGDDDEEEIALAYAASLAEALGPPDQPPPAANRQLVTDDTGLMWDITPRRGEPVAPDVARLLRRPVGIDLAEVERRKQLRDEEG